MENENGTQFLNILLATQDTTPSDDVNIVDLARGIKLVSDIHYADYIDETGTQYGNNAVDTVNALNAIFQTAGSPVSPPIITSATTVNVTQGDTINYELTAIGGVGYEWENLPTGLVTVEGNVRKLVGGELLTPATYPVIARAVNYLGSDVETINFIVAAPPYSNTKSINFINNDYVDSIIPTADMGRTGNGSGASDAWSLSLWFKPGTSNNGNQTIFWFGSNDTSDGGVRLTYRGNNNHLQLRYGTDGDYLQFRTPNNSLTVSTWHHIFVTYDGGTTGQDSGQLSNYYSRFEIWIDGVSQTLNTGHSNNGHDGDIEDSQMRIGRWPDGNYMRNDCRVDELAIWGSDQTSNIAAIYNSGNTHDLSLLGTPPDQWWRMGDGDTFPILQDNIGSDDLIMVSMTPADIVTDAP